MDTKFKKEDIVYESLNPSRKTVVGDFRGRIYYHRLPDNYRRQFVFKERELMAAVIPKGTKGFVL